MKIRMQVAIAASTLACVSTAFAGFEYQLDDGTAENSVGVLMGSISWGNMFAVDGSAQTVTDISFGFGIDQFGGSIVGNMVEWRIWGDADGDPTAGMTQLASGTHAIVNEGFVANGVLDNIAVGGVDVSGGGFFFVSATYTDVTGGGLPATLDQTTSLGQSWVVANADVDDWSGGITIDSVGLPGNWIIRANAVPGPGALALLGLGGLVARRRRG